MFLLGRTENKVYVCVFHRKKRVQNLNPSYHPAFVVISVINPSKILAPKKIFSRLPPLSSLNDLVALDIN